MMKSLFLFITFASTVSGASDATSSSHIASCDLQCANGGYCSLVEGSETELARKAQSGSMVEMCICQPGFTGIACEVEVEQCTLPERKCHNNLPCTKNPNGEWGCDCSIADSLSDFAGRMCRKPITEYCAGKFDPDSPMSFCTNGGRCLSDFASTKSSPGDVNENIKYQNVGCKCSPEFYGPHCEFLRLNLLEELTEEKNIRTNQQKDKSPIASILLTIMLIGLIVVAAAFQRYQRRFQSDAPVYNDGDLSISAISTPTYADDEPEDYYNSGMFNDSFSSLSNGGTPLPTVLETVQLD